MFWHCHSNKQKIVLAWQSLLEKLPTCQKWHHYYVKYTPGAILSIHSLKFSTGCPKSKGTKQNGEFLRRK